MFCIVSMYRPTVSNSAFVFFPIDMFGAGGGGGGDY